MRQTLMKRLNKYILELENAKMGYMRTHDIGWANRVNELQGRVEELRYVIGLIDRKEML